MDYTGTGVSVQLLPMVNSTASAWLVFFLNLTFSHVFLNCELCERDTGRFKMSSLQASPQSSALTSDTDPHFHPYRDSVDTEDPNKINVPVESVRVGRPAHSWRQVLTALAPWSSTSTDDALPSLSDPSQHKRSCSSRWLRGLRRLCIGILIML